MDLNTGFETFNPADRYVDPGIITIQDFLKTNWPDIPNHISGNKSPYSTERARSILGYDPKPNGTYYSFDLMWQETECLRIFPPDRMKL